MNEDIYRNNEPKTLKTVYFSDADALCVFINELRDGGYEPNIVAIVPLGGGEAYRLFYEL